MGYGSSSQCANIAGCTQVWNAMSTIATLQAVTSSGVYFNVADASKIIVAVINCSPGATDISDLYLQMSTYFRSVQGGDYSSAGRAVGTVSITGTAPGANACATHGNISTCVNLTFIGPLDSREYKSSNDNIFLFTSSKQSSNQFIYATVYRMIGGSTS